MSGYVEAGYIVCLGSLGTYAISLVVRERAARRRAGRPVAVRVREQPEKEAKR
jgi:hypothetical protein